MVCRIRQQTGGSFTLRLSHNNHVLMHRGVATVTSVMYTLTYIHWFLCAMSYGRTHTHTHLLPSLMSEVGFIAVVMETPRSCYGI